MKIDALDHPKTWELIGELKVSRPTALGHLELFWHFVSKHAPRGNVGRFPDAAIARGCDWDGDPEAFVKALLKSGFLDASEEHRFLVHDWPEHCPNWVRAQLSKLKTPFFSSTGPTEEASYEASTRARVPKGREGKGSQGKPGEAKPGEGRGSETPADDAPVAHGNGLDPSGPGARIFSDQGSPPSEPSPGARGAAAMRKNGDFEAINDAVSKVLTNPAWGCQASDFDRIAVLCGITPTQAATSVRQLRDRGRLPGVAA